MSSSAGVPVLRLGATAFLSAFFLFQVQPLIAKAVLPWFGGSPGVWTTCMLFFQVLLLVGYALSAWIERLRPLPRLIVPLVMVAVALCTLPLSSRSHLHTVPAEQPLWDLLRLLLVCVGLPYVVLSTTGPLSQTWFRRAAPGRSPYRLYSLSNAGSLLSLLSYPVLIEPWLPLRTQERLWSLGFLSFAVLYGLSVVQDYRGRAAPGAEEPAPDPSVETPPRLLDKLLWVLLPTLSSVVLLAFTNHVCQNVAVIPFLWVAPLSLYLLSFIIAFDHERYYKRAVFAVGALGLIAVSTLFIEPGEKGTRLIFLRELLLHLGTLFFLCMLCHGELVRRKPHPRYLTTFYLLLSAGGALGGILVSVIAPRVFKTFFEWRIALAGGYVLAAVVLLGLLVRFLRRRWWLWAPALALLGAGLIKLYVATAPPRYGKLQETSRNFYGVMYVTDRAANDPEEHDRVLFHGSINHGVQFQSEERRREAVAYYGEETGVGLTLAHFASVPSRQVGVIGLGTGTLASYSASGDAFRFYEINPDVVRLSRKYFTYLSDAKGQTEVVLGDARLTLTRETEPRFHVLVLDAFSGDAIPAHLLTREAMDIYVRRLRPEGALAVHISNRYLDLAPVVRGLAGYAGMGLVWVSTQDTGDEHYATDWIVLTKNQELLRALGPSSKPVEGRVLLWTDEFNDLFRILR